MNKSEKNNDWGHLSSLWKKAPAPNTTDLVNKIKSKTLRMKIFFIFEELVAVFGVILGLYILATNDGIPLIVVGIVVIVLSIYGGYINWWIRKDVWKLASSSPKDQLTLVVNRARYGAKYAKRNLWGHAVTLVVMGFFYWFQWNGILDPEGEKKDRIALVLIFILGFVFISGIGSLIYLKKKRIEGEAYKKLLKELDDDGKEEDDLLPKHEDKDTIQ